MIGLILLYFVGKAFYNLAGQHNRSEWGFAILGVVSYYGGLFVGGFILALIIQAVTGSIDQFSETVLGLMALPFGVLTCWGFYKILERRWNRSPLVNTSDLLDGDLMNNTEPVDNKSAE
jgi:hypothetical protein